MTRSLPVATASPTNHTPTQRQRLDPRWRNMLLTIHIAVAVGVHDIVLLTLGITGLAAPTPELIRAGYLARGLLADAVLLPSALAAPITGILLALGTRWGWRGTGE
jgi:hypothetical protein